MLDRPNWTEEDIPLIKIIAARIGTDIEERILRGQLEQTAKSRERMRVGRDLHDGVLQGLAAASIQLKILSDEASGQVQNRVHAIRSSIAAEAQRIRGFVEESRSPATGPPISSVEVRKSLEHHAQSLGAVWNCKVHIISEPDDLLVSSSTSSHLEHILAEAISNAVRHGGASEVTATIARLVGQLKLRIQDNGRGFPVALGSPSGSPLPRPLSLKSRVEELGGRLDIAPSRPGAPGAELRIELPA